MAVDNASLNVAVSVRETVLAASSTAGSVKATHRINNLSQYLDSAQATKVFSDTLTVPATGTELSIDLTALEPPLGDEITLNTLVPRCIVINAPSDNTAPIIINSGGEVSNMFAGIGEEISLGPGEYLIKYLSDEGEAVGASSKIIEVITADEEAQEVDVLIVAGPAAA